MFGFGRKKHASGEQPNVPCACNGEAPQEVANPCNFEPCRDSVQLKVLGSGCKNCRDLYENAKVAADSVAADVELEYVTDMSRIVEYGVMSTPALVVDGKVASSGVVLSPEAIAAYL